MSDLLKSQMDYIYFFYGLAFVVLALICLFLHRKERGPLPWVWMGLFGASHGVYEWLNLLAFSLGTNPAFDLIRLVLMATSFVFLAEFGRAGVAAVRGHGTPRWVLLVLVGLAGLGYWAGIPGLFISTRFAVGFVGALWAARALYLAAEVNEPGRRMLQAAALGLAGYALATGLTVNPMPFPPASLLNQKFLFTPTGLPIQLGCGFLAYMISLCLWFYAHTSLNRDLDPSTQWRGRYFLLGASGTLIVLLIGGGIITGMLGQDAARELRKDYESQSRLIQYAISEKMDEVDNLVKVLAGSPWIQSALLSRDSRSLVQANAVLDRFSRSLTGSICYLMDRQGITWSSSNRNTPQSFVGKSYNFRPYFQEAVAGHPGKYWGLGVTSEKLGYYASFPVRDAWSTITSIAVIKKKLHELGDVFPRQNIILVIDSRGIVVLSNRPKMQLQSLWPLSPLVRAETIASRQCGPGPFTSIMDREPLDGSECLFQGKRLLALRQPLNRLGWSVVILGSGRPIAIARLLGICVTLVLSLGLLGMLTVVGLTIDSTAMVASSERLHRSLVEGSPNWVSLYDHEGRLLTINHNGSRALGWKQEELLNKPFVELWPEESYSKVKEVVSRVLAGEEETFEGNYIRPDGSEIIWTVALNPVTEADQSIKRFVVIAVDITSRIRAEEALRSSEEKYRSLMTAAGDAILVVDAQTGIILEANRQAGELLGMSAAEIIGMHQTQLYPQEKKEHYHKLLQAHLPKAGILSKAIAMRHRAGHVIPLEITTSLHLVGGRQIVQEIFRDLTMRQKIAEEMTRVSKLESLSLLAGGIAHDFNNLLAAIMGNIEMAQMSKGLAERTKKRLAQAEKGCHHARSLTQRLLTFAKGGVPLKKPMVIGQLISDSAKFALTGSNVNCTVQVKEDLWPVEVDEAQISQVINNLVINGQQAMPNGGIIQINVENTIIKDDHTVTLKTGKYVRVAITDQGEGIPTENLGKIFDPYFSSKANGSGLGLAASYSVIKGHGGYISVDSKVGSGSTFYFYLPVSEKLNQPEEETTEELVRGQGRILILDDEEMIRDFLKDMLSVIGYEVECAKDGHEAIALYADAQRSDRPFAAVIMDLTIPGGMGGKEAIKILLNLDPHCKAIVSSGYSDDQVLSSYASYGFCGVIAKPYQVKKLSRLLHGIVTCPPGLWSAPGKLDHS